MWRAVGAVGVARLPRRLPRWAFSSGQLAYGSGRHACGAHRGYVGAYLERAGAVWGDAAEVHDVAALPAGQGFSWHVDLPPERLHSMHQGEALESQSFPLGAGSRGRFQFFPKGDADCTTDGACSLWLWTDAQQRRRLHLRVAGHEKEGGASEFCRLEDALRHGRVEVGVRFEEPRAEGAAPAPAAVQQSLQLTGLQVAEWRLFDFGSVQKAGQLVSSPPFRFHHVLLGDMYLELLPGQPHAEHCTLFFRCRVPTMKLRVNIVVGSTFAKSFVALGRNTFEKDIESDACLQVNLGAPDTLSPDGSLLIRCALEEVVLIPPALRTMIPKLDERASWPKRL